MDKSLEPKWFVVKGRDDGEEQDKRTLYATDRAAIGLSRLDIFSDLQFTWGRNTILTRLSADDLGNLRSVLSELARDMRESDISAHQGIAECQTVANTVQQESSNAGVKLTALSPKIDIQRQSTTAGALSLHEGNVPLRNKGSGSKKLIAAAMQMRLHGGKNISLIDEIEVGLEPHRIRGLIHRLKSAGQQIFTTTHSPVVIREMTVARDELYVCKRDAAGSVSLESLAVVPHIQGPVRANAEAFLGSKIIACEGLTEIGCLRAYDVYRFSAKDTQDTPVWSLATSYFDAHGGGKIKDICLRLLTLGYRTAALCDNDDQDHLSDEDVEALCDAGIHVCQWDAGNAIEHQLFHDLPWQHVPGLLTTIANNHDTLELATIIDRIRNDDRVAALGFGTDPDTWPESPALRKVMGDLAHEGGWIKRMDYAGEAFRYALPHLPDSTVLKSRLNTLWDWVQHE